MNITPWTRSAALLALLGMVPAYAAEAPANDGQRRAGKGLSEIPDPELNLMRGRYTVNGNSVAWFGVTMISQWQAGTQAAESALTLGMDFTHSATAPKVSFTPSVTVTAADAPLPATPGRSVESAGLQNVAGVTQAIQVAGDNNVASNSTQLSVREGSAPPEQAAPATTVASTQQGGVTAVAQMEGNNAQVQLQIEGVGAVQQWIRNGSVGQTIALSSDGQAVTNRMQIELVRQTLASNAPLSQNVAQAMNMVRGIGMGPGQ